MQPPKIHFLPLPLSRDETQWFHKKTFRLLGLPLMSGGRSGPGQEQGACPAESISWHSPAPVRASLQDGEQTQGGSAPPTPEGRDCSRRSALHTGKDWKLPLFPFSSTAAKSTPFSKRTEQMVGRSCWAARWRAVWRCLVNSFTLAPARSC